MLGINLRFTIIRNLQANNVSERINASIKSTVKTSMKGGYSFQNAVRTHQLMYNSSYHSTITTSPNNVHFSRHLSNIMDTFLSFNFKNRLDVHSHFYMICNNLHRLYDEIYQILISIANITKQTTEKL